MCEFRGANDSATDRIYSQGQNIGNTSYYYTRDHLGPVRELAKSGGSTFGARYDYDPYGHSTTILGTTPTDVNFTGLYRHSKSNLDLAAYRAYDPDLGRWLNRDPLGEPGGLNLYRYGANNPSNLTDRLGLCPGDWWDPRTWFNEGLTDSLGDTWTSLQDSTGDFLTGNWDRLAADAAGNPLGQTENNPTAYHTEVALLTISGVAATTALAAGTVEATTGIRIEIHGTHGRDIWPHLQGIRGPGWGKTLWRWPGH